MCSQSRGTVTEKAGALSGRSRTPEPGGGHRGGRLRSPQPQSRRAPPCPRMGLVLPPLKTSQTSPDAVPLRAGDGFHPTRSASKPTTDVRPCLSGGRHAWPGREGCHTTKPARLVTSVVRGLAACEVALRVPRRRGEDRLTGRMDCCEPCARRDAGSQEREVRSLSPGVVDATRAQPAPTGRGVQLEGRAWCGRSPAKGGRCPWSPHGVPRRP